MKNILTLNLFIAVFFLCEPSFSQGISSPGFFEKEANPSFYTPDKGFYFQKNDTAAGKNKKKVWFVAGAHTAVWVGTYIALNKAWFEGYERTGFHFFNDWNEWSQLDKLGHSWTAYQLSRFSANLWKWSGLPDKTSVWLGSGSAMAYQSIIEIQDAFSAKWGFSWGDMVMNAVGAGGYAAQELTWKEQRIQIKFSYWPHDYPADLKARRDDLYGTGEMERILKDYNSQTYWLSVNPHSFNKKGKFPRWLNIAFGYSSDLMLGGTENKWTDETGAMIDRTDISRIRRFYLSPDIDLTRIKTKSKFLRGVFYVVNMVKIPAPAIELNSKGKLRVHAFYY